MRWRSTVRGDLDAAMSQRFGVQPFRDARQLQHVDRALLQHAGANAAEHVLGRAPLEDHGIDARSMQQLSEQQSGRPGADDGNLCAHS